MLNRIVADS